MSSIIVTIRKNGLILPCPASREADGYAWRCASCNAICCRVSFGVMNGFWRCSCEAQLEIIVDGEPIDLTKFDLSELAPIPEPEPAPITTDEEFLKQCGIEIADTEPTP